MHTQTDSRGDVPQGIATGEPDGVPDVLVQGEVSGVEDSGGNDTPEQAAEVDAIPSSVLSDRLTREFLARIQQGTFVPGEALQQMVTMLKGRNPREFLFVVTPDQLAAVMINPFSTSSSFKNSAGGYVPPVGQHIVITGDGVYSASVPGGRYTTAGLWYDQIPRVLSDPIDDQPSLVFLSKETGAKISEFPCIRVPDGDVIPSILASFPY